MKKIKNTLAIITTSLLLLCNFAPNLAYAASPAQNAAQCGINAAAGTAGCNPDPNATKSVNSTIENVINILSVIVGIIAVIMIIIAGFRYITSGGDRSRVASAKTTLTYAIVGLVIVALAQVIVKFVLNNVAK